MKYSVQHKAIALLLSIIIVFSTLSLTVEKHFCGEFLVDVALFSHAKKCDAESEIKDGITIKTKKPCCKDEVDVLSTDKHIVTPIKSVKAQTSYDFVFENTEILINDSQFVSKRVNAFKHYKPPKIIKNLQVLNDTFLI